MPMDAEHFLNHYFDFLIIGGGTAGLTLASRLSELDDVVVGVIEAGCDRKDDLSVDAPGLFMTLFEQDKYDWQFQTVQQKLADGRVHGWARGKGLGGSSALNTMMWSHPSRRDLDNWVTLGNEGWGWDDLTPYFRKTEAFHLPDLSVYESHYLQPDLHGTNGPVQVCLPQQGGSWVAKMWPDTVKALGYPKATDPRSGSALGGFNQLVSVDPKTSTRSYAVSAYYAPVSGRPNLHVITDAIVTRILFAQQLGEEDIVADGVEFIVGRNKYTARSKNVIVCAGSVQSPQVLELSGIGNPEILAKAKIETKIPNVNVGENLQDHLFMAIGWEVADGVETFESLRDPAMIEAMVKEYAESRTGVLATSVTSTAFVSYAGLGSFSTHEELEKNVHETAAEPAQGTQLPQAQLDLISAQLADPTQAAVQVVPMPAGADMSKSNTSGGITKHSWPGAYVTIGIATTRPFSRGSVHISSPSASDKPRIDPEYLSHPMDVEVLARAGMHVQQYADTEPFASYLKDDGKGGKALMPGTRKFDSLDDAKEHARTNSATEYHPIGTCSMLPRKDGGVVGTDLRVYGTANVRVCDASIFPLHVQGNIQSLVYAVVEKAAEMIKKEITPS
ncbi:alcohol oxidase [Rhizodiscina lignyota]|uniref:Alcohol oxidase n=1 Tax=Rhizodiscina lignyota TaxID=1504668 RepID=A0A9P4I3F4_9PEZI|nr:alcohol oxidase [Rhizodiscina lignyota]